MYSQDMWVVMLEAEIPYTTRVVGMALMKQADRQTGQVNLPMADFLALCEGENEQAAKRHLTRLKQAGFIHYSSCADGALNIFVTFLGWGEGEIGTQMTESSGKGSGQVSIKDVWADPFPEDGEGTIPPHPGPCEVAILLEQVVTLQGQVGQLQTTIGLLCQRLGVEVEIEAKGEVAVEEVTSGAKVGEPRVGFGALGTVGSEGAPEMARPRAESGASMAASAPEIARPRAERGAQRRGFRREEVQQTEVCLFVNTNTTSRDLNNKQTEPVTENAQLSAREEKIGTQITQISQIQNLEEVVESVEPSKKSASSAQSASKSSSPPLDERDRTFKLLTDPEIGVSDREARKLAQSRGFDYTRRQVFAWQKEMAIGKVDGVGALVNRLRRGFGAPEPSMAQQESALYQRHRTTFEIEAEEKAKERYRAMMDAQDKARPQPQAKDQPIRLAPVDPTIWAQTLAALQKDFHGSAIFDTYVAPTRLLGVHDGVYVIGVVDALMLSQISRMKGTLRRHLSEVMGESNVSIRLEIAQTSRKQGIFRAGNYVGSLEQLFGHP